MNWVEEFRAYLIKHPISFFQFDYDEGISIIESRRSCFQFSFTRRHESFSLIKTPSVCFFQFNLGYDLPTKLYIGIAKSKRAVSTLDSAIYILTLGQRSYYIVWNW